MTSARDLPSDSPKNLRPREQHWTTLRTKGLCLKFASIGNVFDNLTFIEQKVMKENEEKKGNKEKSRATTMVASMSQNTQFPLPKRDKDFLRSPPLMQSDVESSPSLYEHLHLPRAFRSRKSAFANCFSQDAHHEAFGSTNVGRRLVKQAAALRRRS
ncbi:hypothetical protein V1478_008210 [Vespula squamosa]|uniref:Uncharacterized protein n=1 Tax=Vespula squamosa TaxID=30214 RepID=A0ABD2AY61_VESSQ